MGENAAIFTDRSAMTNPVDGIDRLLRIRNGAELRAAVSAWAPALTLPHARQLAEHARLQAQVRAELRVAIVHTYTSELLEPWLDFAAALHGLDLSVYHAPYGLALQEATPESPLVMHAPDVTVLMLQRTDLHPALARPIVGLSAEQRTTLMAECSARLREIVETFRAQRVGHLVVSLLPPLQRPALGLFDAQAECSERQGWAAFDAEASSWMRTAVASSTWLDMVALIEEVGYRRAFDLRYWYSSRYPFSPEAGREFAQRVISIAALLKTPRAKVVVLDADNTLWGGVIGEDGLDGIALGPDYPGNVYLAFQRRLLDFQQRGFILAMCSKNNPADVDEVLNSHPHQMLRDEHFAAKRVNWLPKPENLKSLAEELNVGLDSFVFVDDSDHECAAVREALPQIEVVQIPKRAVDIPACLDHVVRLEVLSLTDEDRAKTVMYAQERQRQAVMSGAEGEGDYLGRLQMRMRICIDPLNHLSRLAQLTQKTNQFNLTTRRYDEQRMREFILADACLVADFSLSDVFGDSGTVGLAIIRLHANARAEIDTFLMSCRVIGRSAGEAFLQALLRELASQGFEAVSANYLPTAKNSLVQTFLPDQGFVLHADGAYWRDLRSQVPQSESAFPIAIEMVAAMAITT